MTIIKQTILTLAALSLITPPASAKDWPTWRGPKRDGSSTEKNLLATWPADGPRLAWKATGCGAGYSSVSVANGRVFTMGDGPDGSVVLAFDEKTGKLLWTSEVLGKPGGNYEGTRCTPTVDGDLLFALAQFGDFVCLNVANGKELWRKNLSKDYGGSYSGWNYTESPLVDGDKVMFTPGGKKGAIVALNKKTGSLAWQSTEFTDGAQYSSLIAADINGVHQYIQLTADSVAGVNAGTGKLLWRAERKGQTAVIPTPIYANNQVYVTSGYGVGCNAFKITKDAKGFKTEEIYASKDMANHHGGVILLGNYLYGHSDSGGWICQDFKSGEVKWSDKGVGKGAIAYADGHFYCRSESGKGLVALIEATPEGYKEKSRFEQPDRSSKNSWPHPVIANGKLYLRDQDVLLCYDVQGK
jgi:outer membrane protein assembly factor BamB